MIKIGGYTVDCATNERLTYAATVTKFAVERGAKTADHIIPELPILEFDCIISDTPIGAVAIDPSRVALAGVVLPSQDALEFFTALHEAGEAVTVVCSYGTFDDMAMTSLPMTRDVGTSKALAFSVKFEKLDIRDVQRRSSDKRAAVPNATNKKNLGAHESVRKFLKDEVSYVISYPFSQRETRRKLYGKPILTTTRAVRFAVNGFDKFRVDRVDHYKLGTGDMEGDPKVTLADGFVGPKRLDPDEATGAELEESKQAVNYYFLTGGSTATFQETDRNAAFDHGGNEWTNSAGQPVTRRPPPPELWRRALNGDNQK